MRAERIKNMILNHYPEPDVFEMEDESHKHAGRAGQESHFKVLLVSELFKDQSRVQRQRAINSLLASEFDSGLHALSLRLMTPEEWEKSPQNFKSPDCQGGH